MYNPSTHQRRHRGHRLGQRDGEGQAGPEPTPGSLLSALAAHIYVLRFMDLMLDPAQGSGRRSFLCHLCAESG